MYMIVAHGGISTVNLDAGMTAVESSRGNFKAVKRNIVGVNVDSTERNIAAGSKGQIVGIDGYRFTAKIGRRDTDRMTTVSVVNGALYITSCIDNSCAVA